MGNQRLRHFDVFAGIGGFSLALKGACKTVAYCERDAFCRSVLQANMTRGLLDEARIIDDVHEVTAETIGELEPDIVTAGFPCQDISIMNIKPAGIHGSRSSIIFHLLDQLTGSRVRVLLMENSPAIRTRGLDDLKAACTRAGFPHFAHCIVAAMDVGAPHPRRRWFGMAYKDASDLTLLWEAGVRFDADACVEWWSREPPGCPRLVPRPSAKADVTMLTHRFSVMGNAVVPACVRCAVHKLCMQPLVLPPVNLPQLVFKPHGVDAIHKRGWSTPTRCVTTQCRTLTQRCSRQLHNQVYYEQDTVHGAGMTIVNRASDIEQVNPEWVAWLMGFPLTWTRLAAPL